MSSITSPEIPEISWFGALCDDDYEFLGVPEPALASSWPHCSEIVGTADRNGFDNVLLPSGYTLGIDSTAFAAAIATHTENINLLLAVRMGEMWLPQLARQLASIDQFAQGRLCINIISSDIPGEALESAPRYQRTREWMQVHFNMHTGSRLRLFKKSAPILTSTLSSVSRFSPRLRTAYFKECRDIGQGC